MFSSPKRSLMNRYISFAQSSISGILLSVAFSGLSPAPYTTSWFPNASWRIWFFDPPKMKSTTVRNFGSGKPSFGSFMPRCRRFSAMRSGMDKFLSTGWILHPLTTSKFKHSLRRSYVPFAMAFSQPRSVQLRWCSLLCAALNPFITFMCITCHDFSAIFLVFMDNPSAPACCLPGLFSHRTLSCGVLSYPYFPLFG